MTRIKWWWVHLMALLHIYEVHYGYDPVYEGDWTGMVKMATDRKGNIYVLETKVKEESHG